MSLIELRDIGKIYVSENSVAVGIRGVNAKMDIGEFIAITGASGSGKTTLLNVLSGMDSYEEGEMFVLGEPTSHYIQTDWEEYREKYISFIFQDYNILESFTVLQNVELALTHIKSKKERRRRAEYLIDKVGLTAHKNHKGSKLSGGQKQRTVIARALAKDSPIILADEPTGNLDSRSAYEIISLLKEISTEKLVVVVTHSFDEVKDAATREIRIFDGAIERDTEVRPPEKKDPAAAAANAEKRVEKKKLSFVADGMELGVHRFFAKPKLAVLMSLVMTFAVLATFYITANMLGSADLFFTDYVFVPSDGRVVISRIDGGVITDEEMKGLADKYGAQDHLAFDSALDMEVYLHRPDNYYGYMPVTMRYGTDGFEPDVGRLPEVGEVCLRLPIGMQPYYGKNKLLIDSVISECGSEYKISGVEYFYDNTKSAEMFIRREDFASVTVSEYLGNMQGNFSITCNVDFGGSYFNCNVSNIIVSDDLTGREVFILGQFENSQKPTVSDFKFEIYNSTYMSGSSKYKFDATYNFNKAIAKEQELKDGENTFYYYKIYGVYMSRELAAELIENAVSKIYPQGSLFFEDDEAAKAVCEDIKQEGYFALTTDVHYVDIMGNIVNVIAGVFLFIVWLGAIIFLSFFLSLCIARSIDTLKADVGILRSMGIKINVVKTSMYSIVSLAMIPAIIIFAAVAVFVYTTPQLNPTVPFMHAPQYLFIIIGAIIIDLFLAGRNNKRIFKQSVRKTLRGGND